MLPFPLSHSLTCGTPGLESFLSWISTSTFLTAGSEEGGGGPSTFSGSSSSAPEGSGAASIQKTFTVRQTSITQTFLSRSTHITENTEVPPSSSAPGSILLFFIFLILTLASRASSRAFRFSLRCSRFVRCSAVYTKITNNIRFGFLRQAAYA